MNPFYTSRYSEKGRQTFLHPFFFSSINMTGLKITKQLLNNYKMFHGVLTKNCMQSQENNQRGASRSCAQERCQGSGSISSGIVQSLVTDIRKDGGVAVLVIGPSLNTEQSNLVFQAGMNILTVCLLELLLRYLHLTVRVLRINILKT